jgi:hypothetical protein
VSGLEPLVTIFIMPQKGINFRKATQRIGLGTFTWWNEVGVRTQGFPKNREEFYFQN